LTERIDRLRAIGEHFVELAEQVKSTFLELADHFDKLAHHAKKSLEDDKLVSG